MDELDLRVKAQEAAARPRRLRVAVVALLVAAGVAAQAQANGSVGPSAPWPAFGYDSAGSDGGPAVTGITAANLSTLVPKVVTLPGTVDSSAVYLRNVFVAGARRDVYVVDTTYGRTFALDATAGTILWQFTPRGIASWEGSLQITTASPAVDPGLRYVYSASPDGRIHKLAIANGREAAGRWPVAVTRDPKNEKISSSLKVYGPYVLAALSGLSEKIGSLGGGRVGHLVEIDRQSGRVAHVFNAECSNRETVILASTCDQPEGGIWGRTPVAVDPKGNLLVATANGFWDGRTHWGDSVLELSPTLTPLQSYTPANQERLARDDLDLGSTAPVILTPHIALQAGKDGVLRLLDLDKLNGRAPVAGPYLGGEISTAQAPGGGEVRTQLAVWRRPGREPWVFVANDFGIAGYALVLKPKPHLVLQWTDGRGCSSPVLAGGLLYGYDIITGGLGIYNPDPPQGTAEPNEPLLSLTIPPGHWSSPVVADGHIALGAGNANANETTGTFYMWTLPAG